MKSHSRHAWLKNLHFTSFSGFEFDARIIDVNRASFKDERLMISDGNKSSCWRLRADDVKGSYRNA
jgi:hypothetical protein